MPTVRPPVRFTVTPGRALRRGRPLRALTIVAAATLLVGGCDKGAKAGAPQVATADSLPVFIGDSLPFKYPVGPYIQRIQDNVTLRLYLDEFGRPVPDSTRIHEHAAVAAFDSSALEGAKELVFRPAYKDGKAIPFPVLFPIKFRVPDGPPMPGDSGAPAAPAPAAAAPAPKR